MEHVIGKRYGKLVVLKDMGLRPGTGKPSERRLWLVKCDCGTVKTSKAKYLISGCTRSCGCMQGKFIAEDRRRPRLYFVWAGMIQRCSDPGAINWNRYGGRGISVCDEWRSSYATFEKWALSNGYAEGLDLDRENNDGGYEPSNCRFITHKENMQNLSNSKNRK